MVDDQPANLLVLESLLDVLGHHLVRATSGEEALQLLANEDFAVVLLDVQMPGLDSFETAKLIRSSERSRHTPIIFLTGYDLNRLTVEEAYSLGVVDYLVKPLLPVILRAKVTALVELFEKTERLRELERLEPAEEKARLEEKLLREQAEALEQANRRKDEFLAVLAHEMRNPLGSSVTSSRPSAWPVTIHSSSGRPGDCSIVRSTNSAAWWTTCSTSQGSPKANSSCGGGMWNWPPSSPGPSR